MKPFLSGKKSFSAAPLRPVTGPRSGSPFGGATGVVKPACVGPQVEAVKQGDKVTRLVVTCSCGERIEIDCLYPAGS